MCKRQVRNRSLETLRKQRSLIKSSLNRTNLRNRKKSTKKLRRSTTRKSKMPTSWVTRKATRKSTKRAAQSSQCMNLRLKRPSKKLQI